MLSHFVYLWRRDRKIPPVGTRTALLSFLLLSAFAFKLFFIFWHSNYAGHLTSDMGFYWQRAHDRFQGNYFGKDQWFANPPFFPIFLEQVFKVLYFLGLSHHELAIVTIFFIVASTLSAWGVYAVTLKVTGGFWRALSASALYAFCYPINYFNAFVLTENLAIPLLILVLWLVIRREGSRGWMITAGFLFGAAVAIRVALGTIGAFIFLYLWAARPISWARLQRAFAFSAAFFTTVFFLLVENFFISHGQLRGLAGYFGFNVFLQYCKVRNAFSGSGFYNNPTFIARHPEFGVFHTNHPFNDKAYFLDLVHGCIHNNPHIWIDNLKLFKDVFLYPPWPGFTEVAGYSLWMPFFCYLTLFFTLSIGLFYWVAPRERLWFSRITLLLSPLFCALGMCYFFGMEGRLLIPSLFGLYIVFFANLSHCFQQIKKVVIYFASLGVIFAVFVVVGQFKKNSLLETYGVSAIQRVDLSKASIRFPDATPGDQLGFFIMPNLKNGVLLTSAMPQEAREFEISTDSYDAYQIDFYFKKKKQGGLFLPLVRSPKGGIYKRLLSMPAGLIGKKFDEILVKPLVGDGFYSLAYFILDPIGKNQIKKLYGVASLQQAGLSKVSFRVADASSGDRFGFIMMPDLQSGVLLMMDTPREARRIEISTDSYDSYKVEFYLNDEKKGTLLLPLVMPPKGGTYRRILDMPANMVGEKFDRILVRPVQGDGFYSLAYLILDPA